MRSYRRTSDCTPSAPLTLVIAALALTLSLPGGRS